MSIFSFFSKSKLTKKVSKISSAISEIFTHRKIDSDLAEELEEVLLSSDMGYEVTQLVTEEFKKRKFPKNTTEGEVKKFLAEELTNIILPCQKRLEISPGALQVILFSGVNGAGKTTTIGKIAYNLKKQGKNVLIVACDTFRAAASEQLEVWAKRANCPIIMPKKEEEDPASVAYRAFEFNKTNQQAFDVILIDTAGRLQNKQNLMEELKKIALVITKFDQAIKQRNILIIDATIGQNALSQVSVFDEIIGVSGIIITKLDGSAKAGALIAIAKKFAKPIYAVGMGEKIEDLQEFDAKEFVNNLVGI